MPFSLTTVQLIVIVAAWILAGIFVSAWIHRDAQKRKMKVTLWATIGFFLHILGLIIYLVARPRKPKLVCQQCGREMLSSWDSCPFCGPQQAATGGVTIEPLTSSTPTTKSAPKSDTAPQTPLEDTVAIGRVAPESQGHTVKLQTSEPVLAWLIVKEGKRVGKEFRLLPDVTSIGSDVSNDIVVDDEAVSRQHAKVRIEEDRFMLYDLVSTNGTFVNDQKSGEHALQDGDEVLLGSTPS